MTCHWSALLLLVLALFFSSCSTKDTDHRILVSAADQSLALYHKERLLGRYPISTSRFGLGDRPGSRATPLGRMEVAKMIGEGAPLGAVFKSRRRTGEVLRPDAPGRDPIVTRIIWLKGLEPQNKHAFARCIYIHGTPEERNVGHPASFGCVRMRSVLARQSILSPVLYRNRPSNQLRPPKPNSRTLQSSVRLHRRQSRKLSL